MYEITDKELIIFDMEGTLTHDGVKLPWTEKMLEVIAETEVKCAVISDLPTEKVKTLLAEAEINADIFSSIISTAHYGEGFEASAKEAGTTAEKTVVCTASAVGVKIAKRCGMQVVAARTHFTKEFYTKAGADAVYEDLGEIVEFLGL